MPPSFDPFREKMDAAGLSSAAVNSFARNYDQLLRGESALIPESKIEPVGDLPALEEIRGRGGSSAAGIDDNA